YTIIGLADGGYKQAYYEALYEMLREKGVPVFLALFPEKDGSIEGFGSLIGFVQLAMGIKGTMRRREGNIYCKPHENPHAADAIKEAKFEDQRKGKRDSPASGEKEILPLKSELSSRVSNDDLFEISNVMAQACIDVEALIADAPSSDRAKQVQALIIERLNPLLGKQIVGGSEETILNEIWVEGEESPAVFSQSGGKYNAMLFPTDNHRGSVETKNSPYGVGLMIWQGDQASAHSAKLCYLVQYGGTLGSTVVAARTVDGWEACKFSPVSDGSGKTVGYEPWLDPSGETAAAIMQPEGEASLIYTGAYWDMPPALRGQFSQFLRSQETHSRGFSADIGDIFYVLMRGGLFVDKMTRARSLMHALVNTASGGDSICFTGSGPRHILEMPGFVPGGPESSRGDLAWAVHGNKNITEILRAQASCVGVKVDFVKKLLEQIKSLPGNALENIGVREKIAMLVCKIRDLGAFPQYSAFFDISDPEIGGLLSAIEEKINSDELFDMGFSETVKRERPAGESPLVNETLLGGFFIRYKARLFERASSKEGYLPVQLEQAYRIKQRYDRLDISEIILELDEMLTREGQSGASLRGFAEGAREFYSSHVLSGANAKQPEWEETLVREIRKMRDRTEAEGRTFESVMDEVRGVVLDGRTSIDSESFEGIDEVLTALAGLTREGKIREALDDRRASWPLGMTNMSGEEPAGADVKANSILVAKLEGIVQHIISEEIAGKYPANVENKKVTVAFDPADGSQLFVLKAPVGTIVGIENDKGEVLASAIISYGAETIMTVAIRGIGAWDFKLKSDKRLTLICDYTKKPETSGEFDQAVTSRYAPGGVVSNYTEKEKLWGDFIIMGVGAELATSGCFARDAREMAMLALFGIPVIIHYPTTIYQPHGKLRRKMEIDPTSVLLECVGCTAVDTSYNPKELRGRPVEPFPHGESGVAIQEDAIAAAYWYFSNQLSMGYAAALELFNSDPLKAIANLSPTAPGNPDGMDLNALFVPPIGFLASVVRNAQHADNVRAAAAKALSAHQADIFFVHRALDAAINDLSTDASLRSTCQRAKLDMLMGRAENARALAALDLISKVDTDKLHRLDGKIIEGDAADPRARRLTSDERSRVAKAMLNAASTSTATAPAQTAAHTLILGIRGAGLGGEALLQLQESFEGLSVEARQIPDWADPAFFMEEEVLMEEGFSDRAVLGVILDDVSGLTLEDLEDVITPSALYLLSGKNRVMHELLYAIEDRDRSKISQLVSRNGLADTESRELLAMIVELLAPAERVSIVWQDEAGRVKSAKAQKVAFTAITPDRALASAPVEEALLMLEELRGNRASDGSPKNILIVTNGDSEASIESLNKKLGLDIRDIYSVVTYAQIEERLGQESIASDPVGAVLDFAASVISEDLGRVIYTGGRALLENEIDKAWLINGLLNNVPEAVEAAYNMLGDRMSSVTLEDLKNKVIDMRSHIADIQRARKLSQEPARSL
ncbi:MAG: hypothetical protein ABH875_05210, partial [Candidatus Omnitrophota bacterium]